MEINCYRTTYGYRERRSWGRRDGDGGREGGAECVNNQQRTESQGKAKISVRRPVVNNNNITARPDRSCGGAEGGHGGPKPRNMGNKWISDRKTKHVDGNFSVHVYSGEAL